MDDISENGIIALARRHGLRIPDAAYLELAIRTAFAAQPLPLSLAARHPRRPAGAGGRSDRRDALEIVIAGEPMALRI